MEINPRFTRPLKVCVQAGVDFPLLLYRMARGERPDPMLTYRLGTMVRYLPADLTWFLRSKDRFRARPGFLRTFLEADSDEVFTFGDPGTGLGYLLSYGLDLLHPKSREFRLRLGGPAPKASGK
jgi:predicted ATP-grasp superfamily ATP-dependent carboligase